LAAEMAPREAVLQPWASPELLSLTLGWGFRSRAKNSIAGKLNDG